MTVLRSQIPGRLCTPCVSWDFGFFSLLGGNKKFTLTTAIISGYFRTGFGWNQVGTVVTLPCCHPVLQ